MNRGNNSITVTLTREEIALLKESLRYAEQAFETYQYYPSPEYKHSRLHEVAKLSDKLSHAKKET